MQEYFVDTWFFIADFNRLDSDHRRARQIRSNLPQVILVSHDGVLSEFLTFFADAGEYWRVRAARFVRALALDRTVVLRPADRALFLAALDHYQDRRDKEYSLVDCMSMVVMRERGITHVLTNDHHFSQEGFTLVNE